MSENKQSAQRRTRCRTGCMRCRVRRRKCDEGKPRCRNCIDRNFQCQYGPQLTFLTKNAQTVQSSEVETPSTRYEAIRFVNEEPEKEDDEPSITEDISLPAGNESDQAFLEPANSSLSPETQTAPDAELSAWPFDGPSQSTNGVLSDKDESAVAGLLALGSSRTDIMEPNLSLSDFTTSPITRESQLNHATTPSKLPSIGTVLSPGTMAHLQHSGPNIPPTETLELLRHYRYNVAPWVWDSVLSISGASLNVQQSTNMVNTNPQAPDPEMDITSIAFLRALDATKIFILDTPSAWSSQRGVDRELLEALSPHTVGRDFNSAIYWLFARFDLGAALATDTNFQIPLASSSPHLEGADIRTDPFAFTFCYANHPLWLCARAVEFMHNEDPSPQNLPLQTWMQLVEELDNWYRGRPQGFQPMLELEVDKEIESVKGFPVVLFANGAGLFSNQLYHTAMLLLLHSRPRTARITDFRSATMSPLWHAQRICSIALHNERRECWDPCLLASFLTAARRMTHETQQQEIIRGLSSIREITGWDVGDMLHGLEESWGFLGP
ncbi:hypothetical protein N7494_012726 [Penicillium frequentans]|uniref:Zn(2)-C6 fungal-type domain-containing protein n=1 Tax=Penicillium frequentans TaxID=3151616 RepID=A0AAD6CM99_9EURO|nr:hypothetical protein N7494_012726 [Penicillium glabrum]